jgi:hypothetical protein
VSPLMLALSPLEAFSMPAGMPMLPPLQPLQPLHSVAATLEASSALGIALAALQSGGEGGSSFRFFPVGSPPHPKPPAPRDWQEPLQELKAAPTITLGTSVELCAFKEFVRGRIAEALSAARASTEWRESGLPTYLSKALALVDEDCTLLARQQAVELLGFVALAHSSRATTSSAASTGGPRALIGGQFSCAAGFPTYSLGACDPARAQGHAGGAGGSWPACSGTPIASRVHPAIDHSMHRGCFGHNP